MQTKPALPQITTIATILTEYGFQFDGKQSFHTEHTFFLGSSAVDVYVLVYLVQPDKLDLRIIRYDKRYAAEPFGDAADIVRRQPLFFGIVGAQDETAIRAILQSTIRREKAQID